MQFYTDCRGKHRVATRPATAPPRRMSSPPPAQAGESPVSSSLSPPSPAPAQPERALFSSVEALQRQIGEILATLRAQAPPPAPPRPAFPAAALAQPSAGNTVSSSPALGLPGESSFSVTRCFPWVSPDVATLVQRDQLKPEHLVKLRNLYSKVSKEPSRSFGLTLEAGQLTLLPDSADTGTSFFVKAIPNIAALTQVWLVYTAIRVESTRDFTLNSALLSHLEHLIECDHLYSWKAVTDYHLAICRQRFGRATAADWSSDDSRISARLLQPYLKTSIAAALRADSSSSRPSCSSSRRAGRAVRSSAECHSDACMKFNAGQHCRGCSRQHARIHCQGRHPMAQCPSLVSAAI